MLVDHLIFHCVFTEKALLPPFKGSMLRGSFGHALKKVSCALRRQECRGCLLAASCCYSLIFEGKKLEANTSTYRIRLAATPHPYVLIPPLETTREYETGTPFAFGLRLFGPALRYRPQIIYAATLMGEAGLGRSGSGRFIVTRVLAGDIDIFDNEQQTLSMEETARPLTLETPTNAVSRLRVELRTPLRVKRDNKFQRQISFSTLARAAMRRVAALEHAFGDGEPALDFAGLARKADQIIVADDQTAWCDVTRYSSRQQTAMQIGGVVGSMVFAGELTDFLSLLRYCEKTHLGKQTAFGLGSIEATPL